MRRGSPLPIDPIQRISRDRAVADLARALEAGRRAVATGAAGSSTNLVVAALARRLKRPIVLVVAHLDDADEAEAEIQAMTDGAVPAVLLPALQALPGESAVALELFAARLAAVRDVISWGEGGEVGAAVVVAPVQALMQGVPDPRAMESLSRTIRRGDRLDPTRLAEWLAEAGYRRSDAIEEPGDFAVRGGIVDVFPPAGGHGETGVPVRLDFFGDEVDRLAEVDLDTMGSDRKIDEVELIAVREDLVRSDEKTVSFLELLPRGCVAVLAETLEVVEQARGYYERVSDSRGIEGPPAVLKRLEALHALCEINQFSAGAGSADVRIELPVDRLPQFDNDAGKAVAELRELAGLAEVVVLTKNEGEYARLTELLELHLGEGARRIGREHRYLHRGFVWGGVGSEDLHGDGAGGGGVGGGGGRFALIPYHELVHRYEVRRRATRLRAGRAMDTFLDIQPGDYVVHQDHGIAIFRGLEVMRPKRLKSATGAGAPTDARKKKEEADAEEYLTLEFAGRSKLHVPCTQIDLVQKYVGGFHGKPPLSTIGGQKWKSQKERVSESVRDLAGEMLRVRAAREHMPGIAYPGDTPWMKEFEEEFPYEETEDQLAALLEIKRDMQSPRPMDRLVCGDVGFGKTEVAIRAAFKACEFGKQVAVLVPTTVLAEQHERTFRSRFADYPFRVESLSRFKTAKELGQTLRRLREGAVDVIIGTHRLLSKDVKFADLGLVIIDEEQRFGVEHKEQLLRLRLTVDVLTLSATPIPRTLHMAMLGLRDISSLTTPPLDRRAVVTEVIPYNARRIQQAIARELARGGQCFFVHNRVHNIREIADSIQALAPDARIVVGHGQMEGRELEQVMLKFMRREADILVSTTIIESGIDIPTANTMFINEADKFGLAELHQLRGRVGRHKNRAYCYLLLPPDRPVREVAQKRLKAIEQYSMLGAGFKIAMRDLEIRGAGNILGAEQSGHIAAVGYEMFCRLLENAVHQLTEGRELTYASQTKVDLGLKGIIPRPYIPSDQRRLEAYRRIATAQTPEQLDKVEEDLIAAYGEPPKPVKRLLGLSRVRIHAAALGVHTLTIRGEDVVFLTPEPRRVTDRLAGVHGTVRAVGADLAATNARSATGAPLSEVYWRPPKNFLEPESLMRILAKRLGPPEAPGGPAPRRAGEAVASP